MQKIDQTELKKTFTIKNFTLQRIAGCYVNTNKEKQCTFATNFLNLDEEDQFKYLELLKKSISCKVDNTLQTLPITESDNLKLLKGLRNAELVDDNLLELFYDRVIESYEYIDEYCIFLFYSVYDIPVKNKDKTSQDESEEVYAAIYGLVCPLELSKPGLSYHPDTNTIANRTRDKIITKPTIGFFYPDFNNRTVEENNVVYTMLDKKQTHPEFAKSVLGGCKDMTADEQKTAFDEALSEVIEDEQMNIVSDISDNIFEVIEEYNHHSKTPQVTTDKIKEILIDSGIKQDQANKFVDFYKANNEKNEIRLDNVIDLKKKTYKTPDITINIAPEKRNLITTENRDGKEYIIIALETDVEINGVKTTVNKEK